MKTHKKLTDSILKSLKPKEKEYSLSDDASLYLVVKPTGYKSWRFNNGDLDSLNSLDHVTFQPFCSILSK